MPYLVDLFLIFYIHVYTNVGKCGNYRNISPDMPYLVSNTLAGMYITFYQCCNVGTCGIMPYLVYIFYNNIPILVDAVTCHIWLILYLSILVEVYIMIAPQIFSVQVCSIE